LDIDEGIAMRNVIAFGLALGAVVLLAQSAPAQLLEKKALSLEAAWKMVAAAEAEAERNHWADVVAVVDDGGWVILLERMDHAAMTAIRRAGGGQGAQRHTLQEAHSGTGGRNQPPPLRGDNCSRLHRDAGRSPVIVDGEVIGGIGASFCDTQEDEQVAKAGLAALGG
jgi:glc operon protein GlcG